MPLAGVWRRCGLPSDVRCTDLTGDAEAAAELAHTQPRGALEAAKAVERRAISAKDATAHAVALRALGLASRVLGDLAASQAYLQHSIAVANRAGLATRAGEARITLSSVLLLQGQARAALREATRALPMVVGYEAARLQAQIGLILQRLGRTDEALQSYGIALRSLRRMGRLVDAARVCSNRGILHAYRGNFGAAEADLREAVRIHVELGNDLTAAELRHNLGFVAARRGDIPAALALYDEAAREFDRLDVARPAALLDRCDALLSVGLAKEARQLAAFAADRLREAGFKADLAEARLVLAHACLLCGDSDEAVREATLARRSFASQGRPGWAALARYLALRGRWQQGSLGSDGCSRAVDVAAELESVGWSVAAVDALLIAGRTSAGPRWAVVRRTALMTASARRRTGPADVRARAWHAEALLRAEDGRTQSALAAARAGLRVLDRHQAILGATELRAHAARHGAELAAFGLRLALEGERPTTVLAWAERSRATADRRPRVRPPKDAELARDVAQLRKLAAETDDAFTGIGASSSLRRRVALESAIRRRARHVAGARGTEPSGLPSVGELVESLGEAALVEFLDIDGTVHAVTVAAGRARMHTIGPARHACDEVAQLRFGLERMARTGTPRSSLVAAGVTVDRAARRLDGLLLGPVARAVDDRPLVIVPTGALHDLPWAALPSCVQRPLTVAPSARQWLVARRRPSRKTGRPTLLVAGPGLDRAPAEVRALSALHTDAVTLVGKKASVDHVLAAFRRTELAHIVAHGSLRADNPMFSALSLSDGPLTVYDLERSGETPATVVLASCYLGGSVVGRGDELLGFASSLLALGTCTVVASLAAVPDTTSVELMVQFHRRLRAGAPAATALAEARVTVQRGAHPSDPDAANLVSLAAFGCMGAG